MSRIVVCALLAVMLAPPLSAVAQTRVKVAKNKYTPAQDLQLGRQAAAEIEKKIRINNDPEATNYVRDVGRRLVEAIPPEYQHSEFQYTFKVVDDASINAFALPGGPMYVNTGMIVAAKEEGEMAGVMAHEISHVALRHGTAQATKADNPLLQLGTLGGAIAGAVIGGPLGGVVAQGTQTGLGAFLLKYSREFETEADVLGSQILARAGYDPNDLANMFRTIEQQSGSGGAPEWLSSHPNPSNRYQRISQEARLTPVESPIRETPEFTRVRARLHDRPASAGRGGPVRGDNPPPEDRDPGAGGAAGRVEPPSARYRTAGSGNLFQVSVPENWRELRGDNSLWYAPEGGYGQAQGRQVFTHGVNFGAARAQGRDLREATDQFLRSLAQGNPGLRQAGGYQRSTLDRREALAVPLSHVNDATGEPEIVYVWTTLVGNGGLFYAVAVVPQGEARSYQGVFQNIIRSLRLAQ